MDDWEPLSSSSSSFAATSQNHRPHSRGWVPFDCWEDRGDSDLARLKGDLCTLESVLRPIPNVAAEKSNDDLDRWLSHMEENLTLSWILIDHPSTKRVANVSSRRLVSLNRNWLTREVKVKYVTMVSSKGAEGMDREAVCVVAEVTCRSIEGKEGAVEVREVSLRVEDMEWKSMLGTECLVPATDALTIWVFIEMI